ncbi:hypothetical protein C2R84_01805 [Helicobacter pylori]|nr:hypothetical protein C2R84_01805 [Helicobacter pylori]
MSFLGSFCFKKMPFLQSIAKGLPQVSGNFFFKKSTLKEVFVLRDSFKIRSLGFFGEKSFFKLRLP